MLFDDLPDLALRRVVAALDGASLARLGCCCRAARLWSADDALWAALVAHRFGARQRLPPSEAPPPFPAGLLASVNQEAADGPGGGWVFFPGLEPACADDKEGDENALPPLLPLLRRVAGAERPRRRRGGHCRRGHRPELTPLVVRRALEEADARRAPAVTLEVCDDSGASDSEENLDDDEWEEDVRRQEAAAAAAAAAAATAAAGASGGGGDGGSNGGRAPEEAAAARGGARAGADSDATDADDDDDDDDDDDPFAFCRGVGLATTTTETTTTPAAAAAAAAPRPRVVAAHLVPAGSLPPPRRPPLMRRLSYHPLAGTFVRRDACEELGLRAAAPRAPPADAAAVARPRAAWPPTSLSASAASPSSATAGPPLGGGGPGGSGGSDGVGWVYFPGWRVPPVASVWPRELLASDHFGTGPALLAALSAHHRRAARGGGPAALAQVPQAVEALTGRYHGFSAGRPPPGTTPEAAALSRGTPLPPQGSWRPAPSWSEGVFVRADVVAEHGILQRREWEEEMAAAGAAGQGQGQGQMRGEEEEEGAGGSGSGCANQRGVGAGAPPGTAAAPPCPPHRRVYARLARLATPAARAESCAWLDGAHADIVSRGDATERPAGGTGGGGGGGGGGGQQRLAAGRPSPQVDAGGAAGPVLRVARLCWLDVVVRVPGVPHCCDAADFLRATGQQAQQAGDGRPWEVVWRLDIEDARVSSPLAFTARQQRRSRVRPGLAPQVSEARRVVGADELRRLAASAAASAARGGRRWAEVVVGPLRFVGDDDYATVVAGCSAHDGDWKTNLVFDGVLVRPAAGGASAALTPRSADGRRDVGEFGVERRYLDPDTCAVM